MQTLISDSPRPLRRVHPRHRPLADASNAFLADGSARSLSARTLEQYEWSLRSFASHRARPEEVVLADLDPDAVRSWIEAMKATRRAASVRTAVRALKVFSAWCAQSGYTRTDSLATLRLPRAPRPFVLALSGEQVHALMEAGTPLLRAAVAVLADTGLRASELCGLTIADVHAGFLRVAGKGGHQRLVPYGEACLAEIAHFMGRVRTRPGNGAEPVFLLASGAPLTPHRLGELMRTAGRRAGITGVRVSPHTLRHTFALEFLRNGGGELALQKALGHRSLDMVKVYAELTSADVAAAHRAASPLDRWTAGQASRPRSRRVS